MEAEIIPEPEENKKFNILERGILSMPRGDRTGPMGHGPMTGRRAGYCAGYDRPGFTNPIPGGMGGGYGYGRGMGYGHGGGRGWRNRFYATGVPGRFVGYPAPAYPMDKDQELAMLKSEESELRSALDDISKRIEELEKSG
jgi:hypothetical protein